MTSGVGDGGDGWLIRSQRGAARGHICLYGLVTALFIAYRHAVPQKEDAHRHLELILWLLGATEGGEQLFDFMESTSWPVRSIDVELNLDIAKSKQAPRFVRFSQMRLLSTGRPPKALPEQDLQSSLCSLVLPDLAVFGIHGATSLEPASAIYAAQKAMKSDLGCVSTPPKVRFYGHPCPSYAKTEYLCEWAKVLPDFAEVTPKMDPIAELLATLVDFADQHVEQAWSLHDSLALLFQFVEADAVVRQSFWVCSGPAVLCAMLHIIEPARQMLVWHCRHLLDGMRAQTNGTSTALLGLLRTMAFSRPRCYFVSCEAFAAKQAAWQLAMPEPQVQKRLALYVEPYKWHGLNARSTDVFVMRSMLWSRVPGMYFRAVLQAFLRENAHVVPLNFRFANEVGFVPYSDIALHRCAILVPNDLTMAAFAEAFTMGLPLFLPADEWLYRLQKSVPYGFMVHGAALFGTQLGHLHGSPLPPVWCEKAQSLIAVMSWLRLSDFSTWPSTLRFRSIPDLLEGLVSADFRSVSQEMLRWSSANKDEGLRRWSALLAGMQGGTWSDSEPRSEEIAVKDVSREDVLYAALACEHETFDKFGWPAFRAALETDAVSGSTTGETAAFSEIAISTLQKAFEADRNARSSSVLDAITQPLKHFLTNLTLHGKADIRGLDGYCHLGLACALLLQASQELRHDNVATKVTWLVGLANQLLAPLMEDA
ncbi:unnamed protein product [Symbiodinium natans]|uniref:Uncharacterized protein n=1 Tax=Symbiodinium natans TaxID=878477 RepID=A0A812JM16_9DINO|nr:unnamed protein product [Symbiodinium natans]